jgi:hypothetical protein
MSRNVTAPSARPHLEALEGRDLPSFLYGGGTAPLLRPLKNMVQDMQSTQKDLQAQFNFLFTQSDLHHPIFDNNAAQLGQIGQVFGKAAADWQRMLNDRAAVDALSRQDLAFINQAAMAEAFEGDALDFVLLSFPPFSGLFTAPFDQIRTQADNIIADKGLQNEVSTSFAFQYATSGSTFGTEVFGPIKAQTALPTI